MVDPAEYNKDLCDERHRRLDMDVQSSKDENKTLEDRFDSLKDSLTQRMAQLEVRVAKIMGGLGAALVLVEILMKLFAES